MTVKTSVEERWNNLFATVMKLVRDGKRDPESVAAVLQAIKDDPHFHFSQQTSARLIDWTLADLARYYQECHGITVDSEKIPIPQAYQGFGWLLYIPQGMTLRKAIAGARKRMKVVSYLSDQDLEKIENGQGQAREDRTAKEKGYSIRLRNRIEADEEMRNKSANRLEKEGVKGITLTERIILEGFFFWMFRKHLDIESWTLCFGSRDACGVIPRVYWGESGRVCVDHLYPFYERSCLRAREIVL